MPHNIPFESLPPEDRLIPPCLIEMRLELPVHRPGRNSLELDEPNAFKNMHFSNAGDGDMWLTCLGNQEGCPGGTVKVDRHDTQFPKMPLSVEALGSVCTARFMNYSYEQVVRTIEIVDD